MKSTSPGKPIRKEHSRSSDGCKYDDVLGAILTFLHEVFNLTLKAEQVIMYNSAMKLLLNIESPRFLVEFSPRDEKGEGRYFHL